MKMKTLYCLLAMISPIGANASETISIDTDQVTVAGMSAGAQMAHQLHIAYPEMFSGAALLAGGPFGCAQGSLTTAMSRCMGKLDEDLPIAEFLMQTKAASAAQKLGDLALLKDDQVWVFHGALDTIVASGQGAATVDFYRGMGVSNVRYLDKVLAAHTFPTLENGAACDAVIPPFVGACNFDAAGESLQFLYGELEEPSAELTTKLMEVELPNAQAAGLLEQAYVFTPSVCRSGEESCKAQLILHGCNQSSAQVGTEFIELSGYLQWAEANNIVLAFPQVAVAAANPYACWDWWGYTGENYRWRDGAQMKVLTDWVLQLKS